MKNNKIQCKQYKEYKQRLNVEEIRTKTWQRVCELEPKAITKILNDEWFESLYGIILSNLTVNIYWELTIWSKHDSRILFPELTLNYLLLQLKSLFNLEMALNSNSNLPRINATNKSISFTCLFYDYQK